MASTTFVNYQTVIDAGWLNDVNSAVYSGTFQASTITPTNVTSTGAISGATVAGTTSVTTPIVKSGTSLSLQTNGSTTAVTIDTSQNVGVGVTPSAWQANNKALQLSYGSIVSNTSSGNLDYITNAYHTAASEATGWTYYSTGVASVFAADGTNGGFNWKIAPSGTAGNAITFTQAMTLDSSGDLLVGTTSTVTSGGVGFAAQTDANGVFLARRTNTTSANTAAYFYNPNGIVGSISTSGSLTSYNVSSDYRLKENIVPLTGALNKISALKPSLYNYKSDPSTQIEGFIAHELAEVVPHAVTGEKDATKEEEYEITPAVKNEQGEIVTPAVMGTRTVPDYQGVDVSFLVPHLVAAIQELSEKVTALEAKVGA